MDVQINRIESEMYRSGNREGYIDSMIARFNRETQNSGILKELKKHEVYEKPSVERRRKKINKLIKSAKPTDKELKRSKKAKSVGKEDRQLLTRGILAPRPKKVLDK
jgi:ribosomal protein S21